MMVVSVLLCHPDLAVAHACDKPARQEFSTDAFNWP